jgi:hypothetical protein
MVAPDPTLRCPYCGRPTRLVHVHGHGQCELCGTNIDECCRGEQNALEEEVPPED